MLITGMPGTLQRILGRESLGARLGAAALDERFCEWRNVNAGLTRRQTGTGSSEPLRSSF